jgi:uncharacterized membrane protein
VRRFSFRPALDLRGRKFKGLRGFAGKPFHPPLTDVPVGAYVIAPILDVGAWLSKDSSWADDAYTAAGYVLLLGAVFGVLTVITGYADWLNTEKGTQMRRMVNAHAWTMIVLSAFVYADLWLRFMGDRDAPSALMGLLALVILGLVTLGGTIGGTLTYDFGFNVETATDNPVYHQHERDIIHPHDPAPVE